MLRFLHKSFSSVIHCGTMTPVLAALVGAALLGSPSPAHAIFEIIVTETAGANAGASQTFYGTSIINTGSVTIGDFTVSDTAFSNSAQAAPAAKTAVNTLSIANNSMGFATLTVQVTDNGFQIPTPGPVILTSSNASTNTLMSGESISYTSKLIDGSNTTTSPTLVYNSVGGSGFNNKNSTDALLTVDPFTLTSLTTITVAGGDELQSNGTTMLATPAPAGIVLALTGLPLLGLGLLRRRMRRA